MRLARCHRCGAVQGTIMDRVADWVSKHSGELTSRTELATAIAASRAWVSKALDTLEQQGWIRVELEGWERKKQGSRKLERFYDLQGE